MNYDGNVWMVVEQQASQGFEKGLEKLLELRQRVADMLQGQHPGKVVDAAVAYDALYSKLSAIAAAADRNSEMAVPRCCPPQLPKGTKCRYELHSLPADAHYWRGEVTYFDLSYITRKAEQEMYRWIDEDGCERSIIAQYIDWDAVTGKPLDRQMDRLWTAVGMEPW